MSASSAKDLTLKELRAVRRSMLSARWTLSLEKTDENTRNRAAKQLLQVNHAILGLENAQLSELRTSLLENEVGLVQSIKTVEKAMSDLGKVESVLGAVAGFLGIVGKVVAIFA